MANWTDGYVAEIDYTHGYYVELNPLRVQLALLASGLVPPAIETACELGFGQGMSVNLLAAAGAVQWCGTDFNPAHAGFAREMAAVSGSAARLYDEAFAEFAARSDLPDFDFIALHGIWSWISDANRAVIVEFVRRRLKVGGVLYVSYNTQPGWAQMLPMRHLLAEHAAELGAQGGSILQRVDAALEFAERLLATNPLYSRVNPLVGERLQQMKTQDRHYLAHEYFNRDWAPMPFARMAEWLEPAKLTHAGSAHFLDHVDLVNLSGDQQALLASLPEGNFRQTVRDFMVNQQFRRDYWVRGARRLSALEQGERLRATPVVLISERAHVTYKVNGALGEAGLNEAVYAPLLEQVADHGVRTIGEIESALLARGLNRAQVLQAVFVLLGKGDLAPAQSPHPQHPCRASAARLNAWALNKARGSVEISYLASPVTGGGVPVNRIQQLFLLALQQGRQDAAGLADSVWQVLSSQNQRLLRDGRALANEADNLAELQAQATAFLERRLPLLRSLQVC